MRSAFGAAARNARAAQGQAEAWDVFGPQLTLPDPLLRQLQRRAGFTALPVPAQDQELR